MSEIKNKDDKNFHMGHRDRLRARYIENGIDSLAEHEILELLLFYGIPRVDTKPIAHKLIDVYGSLSGVLSAPHESLVSNGLTNACATFLRCVSDINEWTARHGVVGTIMKSHNEMGRFFVREMGNDKTERVVMLMLDNKDRVIGCETLCAGTFSSVKINTRKIADICVMRGVSKVAFAHNHPRDNGAFSINDHATNSSVEMLCSMLDVEFLEHFVIMGDGYFGLKRQLEDSKSMSLKEYMKNNGFDGEL